MLILLTLKSWWGSANPTEFILAATNSWRGEYSVLPRFKNYFVLAYWWGSKEQDVNKFDKNRFYSNDG